MIIEIIFRFDIRIYLQEIICSVQVFFSMPLFVKKESDSKFSPSKNTLWLITGELTPPRSLSSIENWMTSKRIMDSLYLIENLNE